MSCTRSIWHFRLFHAKHLNGERWQKQFYHGYHHSGSQKPKSCQTVSLLSYKWPNNVPHAPPHKQLACLPERCLEDLSWGALFGVVVVSVEKVSEHSLVGGDIRCFHTVYSLGAGLRQRQARPPIWTTLVVLDTPKVTEVHVISLIHIFTSFLPENGDISLSVNYLASLSSCISWILFTVVLQSEEIISMQRAQQQHFQVKVNYV